MRIDETRHLWEPAGVYCNTASYGLPPRPAWEALQAALADWHGGRTSWEHWGDSTEGVARGVRAAGRGRRRARGRRLDRVRVGRNGGHGPAPGARVVVPDIEFTSTLFPLLVQQRLDVRTVPTDRLADAIAEGVDAAVFSAVQMSTGEVADLDAIRRGGGDVGAVTVCDATQAIGWLPLRPAASTRSCAAPTSG